MPEDRDAPAPDFTVRDAVTVYLQQNAAQNQLWTMYVVATFTAIAFAVNAASQHSAILLAAGAIGFLAFTTGHLWLIRSGLALLNAAAADIADLSRDREQVAGARIRAQLSRPVRVRASLLAHWAIDACVLAGFAYGAWTLAQPR
ncbi:hypothetical protein Q9Q95_20685 [Sphingomonas sp. DG1-23]|uniref:hypothetical protein n=1 Tax=Sphingomonas sp. DG1-23 TaxID=3068316 RepID=UPI00273DA67E|nr:hypothetical protein [Sphingomonas sp. DG1-23]MDP5281355.1 hypothetical protein [Sphingomonas sp. DG1-23]